MTMENLSKVFELPNLDQSNQNLIRSGYLGLDTVFFWLP